MMIKTQFRFSGFKRVLALWVLISFLTTNHFAYAAPAVLRHPEVLYAEGSAFSSLDQLQIPAEIGKIQDTFAASCKPQVAGLKPEACRL